ncbi:M50 family metallopeptidase [Candidatus Gromoviella agglomerans]|uniref:M50 family metallopeptidase n=1 Tax=Candidatus Gromoviella agglomerans TaxID=2806609 RepID=UPI0023676FE2|nr:M50 family metallopeptidase [Candidatus Gromoviella agglomerans]UFX98354.1 Intramembrane zinc metalloprotease RseP [Candidatus Gromoviella agglomerans]
MIIEFFNHLWPFVIFIVIMVTLHELGHYIAARKFGIFVETFSIGFGPKLFSLEDKQGTTWKLCAIPFGGYIALAGEYSTSINKEHAHRITSKKGVGDATPLQKIIIAIAGPFANYFSALIVSTILLFQYGEPYQSNIISKISEESIAEKIGLQVGDELYFANSANETTYLIDDIMKMIKSGKKMSLSTRTHNQNGELINENCIELAESEYPRIIGINMKVMYHKYPIHNCLTHSIYKCSKIFYESISNVFLIIKDKQSVNNFAGPLKIASIIKSSMTDIRAILSIFILLSLSIGAMNMLPLPGLDGFTAFIGCIELVSRRKLPKNILNILTILGFVIITTFSLYMLFREIMQLNCIKVLLN